MRKPGHIRVIALGLIRANDRIFVSEGYDSVKQQRFYRALGGGVDFGETSLEALQREFQEEVQAELVNIKYLGCIENIFSFEGQPGHELIQLYECDFADPKFYELESLTFNERDRPHKAMWIEVERIRSGDLRLVPESFLDYLKPSA
ncbi:NUDIX hydrolase [Oculatella sp. LEGE 06141]|uniref:NUDIX hydrolase n=1 Tax=Oculatella sp. LEGE 06141 TaxID=1828648 RepID=UPI00188239AB|nr:NUDIX hydrolase [Oculatella sp. LEGE 06141]MBE9180768.1 NUDIX hydrolase [Oculatella sp. LEGE 06141]